MSTACPQYASANLAFRFTLAVSSTLTRIQCPTAASTLLPSLASMTQIGVRTVPTFRVESSAPAKPTDCTIAGAYRLIIASVALCAASCPMPPQTSTALSFSKNLYLWPSYSRSTGRQDLISGKTSRSMAATIATFELLLNIQVLLHFARPSVTTQAATIRTHSLGTIPQPGTAHHLQELPS